MHEGFAIQSLGYIGFTARDPRAMAGFSTEILGAPVTAPETGGAQYIRLDERHHRIAVFPGESDATLLRLGFELRDARELGAASARLEAAGIAVRRGSQEECEERRINEFIAFRDPAGHPIELFYGYYDIAQPCRPTRAISGFKALGHLVLGVEDVAAIESFYVDVLGFGVSDYADYERAGKRASAAFLHCADKRHHSIAFGNFSTGIHHILLEMNSLDDVGTTYDLIQEKGVEIARTFGRHSNDQMISFYVPTPCGVKIEYGFGGRLIDDNWRIVRSRRISLWGHELRIP